MDSTLNTPDKNDIIVYGLDSTLHVVPSNIDSQESLRSKTVTKELGEKILAVKVSNILKFIVVIGIKSLLVLD